MAGLDTYPHPTSNAVVAVMKANRSADTRPEVAVRSLLHRRGHRFRKDYAVALPSRRVRVDVAFPRQRLAVFIDGCFWHSCPEHGHVPRVNEQYWVPKFERNARRDVLVNKALSEAGWRVLRFWEHEEPADTVDKIASALTEAE